MLFRSAFHGRSIATLSATGNPKVQAGFGPLVEGFVRLPLNDLDVVRAIWGETTHRPGGKYTSAGSGTATAAAIAAAIACEQSTPGTTPVPNSRMSKRSSGGLRSGSNRPTGYAAARWETIPAAHAWAIMSWPAWVG